MRTPIHINLDYQPHIDGLRAVAVLMVLFYHLKWSWFPGGFVGVDIFFVISGYLITKIIISQIAAGTFSLRAFYMRRAKRLLPAFIVTILLSFIAASMLMTPADLQSFAHSVIAATFSVSNIFFWTDSGYFAADSLTKPLLHTWSLSVEEQFYLIFPILTVVILQHRSTKFMLGILLVSGLASLTLNFAFQAGISLPPNSGPLAEWMADGASTIYYLAPFRAFEFVIGAALVWAKWPRSTSRLAQDFATIFGAVLIAISTIWFTAETPFPSYNALFPCVGAAALIWGGLGRAGGLLRVKPVLIIGKSSYSIYLVHWPIIALWAYYRFGAITAAETTVIALTSVAFGIALNLLIERPARFGKLSLMLATPRSVAMAAVAVAALIVIPAASVTLGNGWAWRISGNAIHIVGIPGAAYAEIKGPLEGGYGCKDFCDFGDTSQKQIVLLVGDSHANQYVKALNERHDGIHYRLFQSAQCFVGATLDNTLKDHYAESCDAIRAEFNKWLDDDRVIAVIQSQHWSRYYRMKLRADGSNVDLSSDGYDRFGTLISDSLANYRNFKGSVVLVGLAPASNFNCNLRPTLIAFQCPNVTKDLPDRVEAAARKAIEGNTKLSFVNPGPLICPHGQCILTEDGLPLYTDTDHLSVVGARLVVPEIVEALKRGLSMPH